MNVSSGVIAALVFVLVCAGIYAGYQAIERVIPVSGCEARAQSYCAPGER